MGKEVLAARRDLLGSDHPNTLATIDRLAAGLSDIGAHKEALTLLRDAAADFKKQPPADAAIARATFASITSEAGDAAGALPLFDEALRALGDTPGKDHPQTLVYRVKYGEALRSLGRFDDAIREIKAVTEIQIGEYGADNPATIPARSQLALTYATAKRFDEAIATYAPLEQLIKDSYPPGHALIGKIAKRLAELREAASRKK